MNNLPAHFDNSDDHKTDAPMMWFGKRHVHHWAFYSALGILTAVLLIMISYLDVSYQIPQPLSDGPERNMKEPVFVSGESGATANLIVQLKHYGLWDLPASEEVPRFFIKNYPADLNTVKDVSVRKKVFLHSLLPHALFVRQETLHKRDKLQSILSKIDCAVETLDFVNGLEYESQCSWTDFLEEEEVNFIQILGKEYRTTSVEILLERVDLVPTSIILAQGALESSWGSSRFTREGNSIFGMWTWKTAGIVPSRREEGKTHKVKAYENVLEAVRAYHLTLNRVEYYEEFRQLRRNTDNPLILAEGLRFYSERGQDYVEDIKNVILSNGLQRYDNFSLTDLDLPEFTGSVSGDINAAESSKTSL